MKKYVIVTDSSSDLNKTLRQKYDIEYIPMRILYDDKDIPADLDWGTIGVKDFYKMMRDGVHFKTAQISIADCKEAFEKYIKEGYDILSLSCSGALSSSHKMTLVVREELLAKYPDAKIECIDTLNSCAGLGILCTTASQMRAEGKTIEEVAEYIKKHKKEINQIGAVDSLVYLKRAGRVNTMSAVFGGLLQVKPILISDALGQNFAIEKVKGRKNSLDRVGDMFLETYKPDHEYQRICLVHADCEEDAEYLKKYISDRGELKQEIEVDYLGPIIGASAGPGMIALYCYGNEVTVNGK